MFNRTKIIATIGPATSDEKTLKEIIDAGVDVCRLNFSHGSHHEHLEVLNLVRKINLEHNLTISILGDLQGPKLRIGEIVDDKQVLVPGNFVFITTNEVIGTTERFSISYKKFPQDTQPGEKILIDDGKIELEVVDSNGEDEVKARVVYGGRLSPRKGFNLPNTKVSLPSLTEKDLRDLEFLLEHDVEWIALSFVRNETEIRQLRKIIRDRKKTAKIIAKIEKPEAIENLQLIVEETDAVMIARGDLGVEVPMEELPLIQKRIVKMCLEFAKPVIIATQIMESMVTNPKPTRAEINDVANAVLDGADALMLSGETSTGKYPVEVIQSMQKIIHAIEQNDSIYTINHATSPTSITFLSDAISQHAALLAAEVDASAIIGMTRSGYTAFKVSSYRPKARIYIFSDNRALLSMLTLVWGVKGFIYTKFVSTDQTFADVQEILKANGSIRKGDVVINLASMPILEKGKTNTIKVSHVN